MNSRITLAAVLPVVLACAACGGSSQSTTTASPVASTSVVASTNTAAPAPQAAVVPAQAPITPAPHAAVAPTNRGSTAHASAHASTAHPAAAPTTRVAGSSACLDCATVMDVQTVKHKGDGGAVGMIGGAVVGGLLGHQVGGGTGKTLATVGGAAAGAFAGNEVQKHVNAKTVWVTTVRMKDGSTQTFEQEAQPGWKAGQSVHVRQGTLRAL